MATLALSSEQLEILHGAAAAVPPNWQSRFFSAVADLLTLNENPSNRDVLQAISDARRSFALGTDPTTAEKARRSAYRRRAQPRPHPHVAPMALGSPIPP
jgi:hypothetical protein